MDYTPEFQQQASKLFRGECQFKIGAIKISDIPDSMTMNEVAFAGRSNVGKSSLLNSLTGQKSLARVSNTPGRTTQLNFFSLRDQLMLVDLPGYGYARASKRAIKGWTKLIHHYLLGRPNLRQICLLIDARHGMKDSDLSLMKELDESAVSYRIILTKCDKAAKIEALRSDIQQLQSTHTAMHPEIICTSSRNKTGILALQCALFSFASKA